MNAQPSLFDAAPRKPSELPPKGDVTARRHRGNPESIAAHKKIEGVKTEIQDRIWNWFLYFGSGACEQCANQLHLRYTTVSGRISELKRDGWLIKVGTSVTSGGSSCAVLRALTAHERELRKTQ